MEPPRAYRASVSQTPSPFKWRTILALALLFIAIVFDWSWAFGILFIAWAVSDIIAGRIYFVEVIAKSEHPILFWTMAILWLLMGLYTLVEPFLQSALS